MDDISIDYDVFMELQQQEEDSYSRFKAGMEKANQHLENTLKTLDDSLAYCREQKLELEKGRLEREQRNKLWEEKQLNEK